MAVEEGGGNAPVQWAVFLKILCIQACRCNSTWHYGHAGWCITGQWERTQQHSLLVCGFVFSKLLSCQRLAVCKSTFECACVCVYMPLERDESGNKERRKTLKLGGNWLFPCCILKLGEFWEVNMRLFLCFGCSCFKLLAIKEYLLLQCSGKYLPS